MALRKFYDFWPVPLHHAHIPFALIFQKPTPLHCIIKSLTPLPAYITFYECPLVWNNFQGTHFWNNVQVSNWWLKFEAEKCWLTTVLHFLLARMGERVFITTCLRDCYVQHKNYMHFLGKRINFKVKINLPLAQNKIYPLQFQPLHRFQHSSYSGL